MTKPHRQKKKKVKPNLGQKDKEAEPLANHKNLTWLKYMRLKTPGKDGMQQYETTHANRRLCFFSDFGMESGDGDSALVVVG